jgi:hypothetical protein
VLTCCPRLFLHRLHLVQFVDVIASYPLQPQPEIFGLHANADITCQQAEAYELLGTVLSLQPRTTTAGSAADSQEAVVARVAHNILGKVSEAALRPLGREVCLA